MCFSIHLLISYLFPSFFSSQRAFFKKAHRTTMMFANYVVVTSPNKSLSCTHKKERGERKTNCVLKYFYLFFLLSHFLIMIAEDVAFPSLSPSQSHTATTTTPQVNKGVWKKCWREKGKEMIYVKRGHWHDSLRGERRKRDVQGVHYSCLIYTALTDVRCCFLRGGREALIMTQFFKWAFLS